MSRYIQDLLDVNYSISITYLPANQTVSFSAFLENFSDEFKQEWSSEDVYGRMDPILTYKNTKRSIQISFEVPSESSADAEANFIKLSKLVKFCYPVYEKSVDFSSTEAILGEIQGELPIQKGNSMLLSAPPLVGIKFANLISAPGSGGKLIGKLDGVKYTIEKDQTFYSVNNKLFTNVFKIDLNMTVIHTSPLGWERDGRTTSLRDTKFKFPYSF